MRSVTFNDAKNSKRLVECNSQSYSLKVFPTTDEIGQLLLSTRQIHHNDSCMICRCCLCTLNINLITFNANIRLVIQSTNYYYYLTNLACYQLPKQFQYFKSINKELSCRLLSDNSIHFGLAKKSQRQIFMNRGNNIDNCYTLTLGSIIIQH